MSLALDFVGIFVAESAYKAGLEFRAIHETFGQRTLREAFRLTPVGFASPLLLSGIEPRTTCAYDQADLQEARGTDGLLIGSPAVGGVPYGVYFCGECKTLYHLPLPIRKG